MSSKDYAKKVDDLKRYKSTINYYQKISAMSLEELANNPNPDFYINPERYRNSANSFIAEYSMKAHQLEQEIKEYRNQQYDKIINRKSSDESKDLKEIKRKDPGFIQRVLGNI